MKTIIIDGIEYNLTPKVLFKKGDFVVIQETTYLISKIEGINVTLFCNGRECLFDIDVLKNARLWDISKDAKDGDVLVCPKYAGDIISNIFIFKNIKVKDNEVFCHCSFSQTFRTEGYVANADPINTDFYPASKEQRDLLFQKMKEAGYEWDAEKKKLGKIEQEENVELTDFESALFSAFSYAWQEYLSGKEVNVAKWARENSAELLEVAREQKPACAWSKEDETYLDHIITAIKSYYTDDKGKENPWRNELLRWLKSLKDRVQPKQEWSEEDEEMYKEVLTNIIYAKNDLKVKECLGLSKRAMKAFNWFSKRYKSLKPQSRWKPSNEQIGAIEAVINNRSFQTRHLYSLYEQLKKLREE